MRYRLQRHDGTDCSATMVPITVLRMVPIQRYRHYTNVQTYNENLVWDTSYSDMQTIYAGGRPKTNLIIRMTPSFETDLLPQLEGCTVYAYNVNLHIFLNYIGDAANIPPEIFITQGFPHNEDSFFQSNIQQIQTL